MLVPECTISTKKIPKNFGSNRTKTGYDMDKLVENIRNSENFYQAIDELASFKEQNDGVLCNESNGSLSNGNVYVVPGFVERPVRESLKSNLKFLNRLGHCKTSAPVLLNHAATKDGKFGVIVYKINDTKGGTLIPYEEARGVQRDKKEQFLKEQVELLDDTGLYNKNILKNYDVWNITPDTGNIFVGSWESLKRCSSVQEKNEVKERLKEMLFV